MKNLNIKSSACSQVLKLMDKDYDYEEAVQFVLNMRPSLIKEELEKELNLYI